MTLDLTHQNINLNIVDFYFDKSYIILDYLFCQCIKTIFMKGNINMEKQKRITLNADKRKVIADVFQQSF